MTLEFTPLDLQTWPRRDYFYYFTKMMPTGFTINMDVDITATYLAAKQHHYHFFAVYLYLITHLISEQPEFMIAQRDGQLGHYTNLTPSYSIFHEDDQTISGMWTTYDSNLSNFHENYLTDLEQYQAQHGAMIKSDQPENAYMINMNPWLHFNSYTPLTFNGLPNYLPVIEAGKYVVQAGKRIMPLSFTIHHAVADAYHVSHFFQRLQSSLDHPEDWLL